MQPLRAVAATAVLSLLAGVGTAAVLHDRDRRADRAAREALAAATFGVEAVGVATTRRVAVVLTVTSSTPARVVDARVTGEGWTAVHGKGVGLATAVDCVNPPAPLRAAEAVVELHGQQRTIDLLADPAVFDVVRSTSREACGDVDAGHALLTKASTTVRKGKQLSLDLTMTNRSVHPVTLRGVAVPGLRTATSRPLPLVLAPRSTRKLHVVLTLGGCGLPPDELSVQLRVDGTGGAGEPAVSSPKLLLLVTDLRAESCGR